MVGHYKQPAGIDNSNSFPTTFEQSKSARQVIASCNFRRWRWLE